MFNCVYGKTRVGYCWNLQFVIAFNKGVCYNYKLCSCLSNHIPVDHYICIVYAVSACFSMVYCRQCACACGCFCIFKWELKLKPLKPLTIVPSAKSCICLVSTEIHSVSDAPSLCLAPVTTEAKQVHNQACEIKHGLCCLCFSLSSLHHQMLQNWRGNLTVNSITVCKSFGNLQRDLENKRPQWIQLSLKWK